MDDSDLYTGVVPGEEMFANEQEPRNVKEEKEAQQAALEALLPSVDVIRQHIIEEKEAVGDIRSYLSTLEDSVSGEDIKAEYRARELYIGYLTRLESDIITRVTDYQEATK